MQSISTATLRVVLALSTILIIVSPVGVAAEPIVRAGMTSYFVGGVTADEILKDILDKAPASPDGVRRAAFTTWDVQWRWKLDKQDNQCSIAKAVSVVEVSVWMPKLRDETKVPKSLLERWKRYAKALRDQEDGHKDIAVNAGKGIEATLLKLKPEPSCDALEARADQVAKEMLEKFRRVDEAHTSNATPYRL